MNDDSSPFVSPQNTDLSESFQIIKEEINLEDLHIAPDQTLGSKDIDTVDTADLQSNTSLFVSCIVREPK